MFATASNPYDYTQLEHSYMPSVPSPLSPRSANINGIPRHQFTMSSCTKPPSDKEQERRNTHKENANYVPFSKRPLKKAPVGNAEEAKEKRRSLFLKKVREARDDKRFELRGDDIMRLDYVREHRAWEAELARSAPKLPSEPPDEDEEGDTPDLPSYVSSSAGDSGDMTMSQPGSQFPAVGDEIDNVLQQEDEELEALLGFLPQTEGLDIPVIPSMRRDETAANIWSDDDDYDAIFAELGNDGDIGVHKSHGYALSGDQDAMDVT